MARPKKVGMDYFPVDTTWDVKMQLIKAKFGLEGIGCIIELFKAIYHEGYYLKWDDDARLLFSSDNGITIEWLDEVVSFAVGKRLFHAGKLDKMGVLTSNGIQKRWLQVSKDSNRATREIDAALCIDDENEFPAQEIPCKGGVSGTENPVSGTDNPHIILNDIILNKRKEESLPPEARSLSELLYALHVEKIDKGKKRPTDRILKNWAEDIDKLNRLDGRPWEDIEKVIRWVKVKGQFWSSNIMSGSKLREKFDTLYAQMTDPGRGGNKAPKVHERTAFLDMEE